MHIETRDTTVDRGPTERAQRVPVPGARVGAGCRGTWRWPVGPSCFG